MSRKGVKAIFSFLAILTFFSAIPLAINTAKAQELPPMVTAYSSISVRVDNQNFKNLYNFTTNLENDSLWFPDVEETQVISEGDANGVGKEYIQRSYFNGIPLDTNVKVLSAKKPFYYYIEGTGMFASYKALYTFSPSLRGRGGVFTLTTEFNAPGITEESLSQLLNLAMQNILDYYESTGEINLNFVYIP